MFNHFDIQKKNPCRIKEWKVVFFYLYGEKFVVSGSLGLWKPLRARCPYCTDTYKIEIPKRHFNPQYIKDTWNNEGNQLSIYFYFIFKQSIMLCGVCESWNRVNRCSCYNPLLVLNNFKRIEVIESQFIEIWVKFSTVSLVLRMFSPIPCL